MAEMSTATRDNDLDDAAGQYPSTVMNKYHCEITQERAGDDDYDQSDVVGRQRIEKMGTGPLPKESEYHPRNNHAPEESGTTTKYSGISEKNLVGGEESKEMAFDDDGQHPTKKVGEVGEYPPPKKNHQESGKYSSISKKNLVGDAESKEMDNKRKDDDDNDDHSSIGDGQEDDRFDDAEEDDDEDDHPDVGGGQEDDRFDDPKEIDPERKKQSTTSTPWSILQHCSWLLKRPSES
jgi:hypothetical protein